MKSKDQIVRIIDGTNQNFNTKILWFSFKSSINLNYLFTPKLENISFIKYQNIVTVNLKNILFIDFFNEWIMKFIDKINVNDTDEDLILKFNSEVKALILIGQKEKTISWESARGLYGELLLLKSMLQSQSYTESEILDSWHRPSPANHDFDFSTMSIEVKTISRDSTTIKISSQFQLDAVENKQLKLKCYRIEKTESQSIDSVGQLYNELKQLLNVGNRTLFELKCAEDVYFQYLGPDLMPLNFKFITIEEMLYNVDQLNFPRIKKETIHSAISKCNYCIDISALDLFKIV